MTILRTLSHEPTSPPEAPLIARQREILRAILQLVRERAAAEAEVTRTRSSNDGSADSDYQEKRRILLERYEMMKETDRKTDEDRRRRITDESIAAESVAKSEFARASRKIATDFDAAREKAKSDHARARVKLTSEFEAGDKESKAHHAADRRPIDDVAKIGGAMHARLDAIYDAYKVFGLPEAPTAPARSSHKPADPIDKMYDRLQKLEPNLAMLEGLVIPKMMVGRKPIRIFIALFVLACPLLFLIDWTIALPISMVNAVVGGLFLRHQLIGLSRVQVGKLYYPLMQSLLDIEAIVSARRLEADEKFKAKVLAIVEARDLATATAKARQGKAIQDSEAARDENLRKINEVYAKRMVENQTRMAVEMRDAVAAHEKAAAELPVLFEAGSKKLDEKYATIKEKIRDHHASAWETLSQRWREGMTRAQGSLDAIVREVDAIGPRWDDPAWNDRPPATATPPVLRVGEVRLDLATLPGGISTSPELMDGIATTFAFPTLTPFPDQGNLLVESPPIGRGAAVGVVQSAMFRLITSLPPGQVRFTIVDPVGIGRNFGAFMHLADFDEALVNGQVWTDARQIEERLADLSAHMEKVTQKYLRDEYASIDEYNAVAGEVAEPYRVLVVADFPAGFDERAAARLAAISANGIRCGVLTLIARDVDRPLPSGIAPEELKANAFALTWDGSKLTRPDADFDPFPLVLDAPPTGEFGSKLVHRAGSSARDAKRVEVPFDFIAPGLDDWWKLDSRTGIDIPLGKVGATKRQNLTLGKGTSQHVLVAGRTGSGKSTLLHALIVNLALNYSPDEVELYLIDFKKGVEFKVYATYGLPHAAVVAIESEREFGISVLQRLDVEMGTRADKFRDVGVADLNGYRNAPGTPPMPRIMLIVDEFQEFFVEEDKLAQEAALLLDRLVRQGRAFGVHIHLGSQSLGGAYALARTTLGQMAVRIALQCAEADAHLILSEHNSAAKLLSRPGEAIYNDANGMVEANHFFQVVWLSDSIREGYLAKLRDLAIERKPVLARVPIVFEGDTQADPARNPMLKPLMDAPTWARSPKSATAWLGDAIAIKDPTSAIFRRQGGNHLLVVGQNADAALGIMASSLISLAAQYPPPKAMPARFGARFAIIDGTPEDDARAEFLAKVAGILPHPVDVGGFREAGRIVTALAEEVARRQQPDADDGPEIFLILHDLGRFRDLRRRENDFGFGREGDEASPTDHLNLILREGSSLGVHVLTWSDTMSNLNRAFDTQGIREFESRVLFQMSANDSAHLLDSPAASKLGPNRALFSGEEQNRLEKFRPYGLPSDEWLEDLRQRFATRS